MRLFLAGPMSGRPQFNYPVFDAAARRLRNLGHTVYSPADPNGDEGHVALALDSPHGDLTDLEGTGYSWDQFLETTLNELDAGDYDGIVCLEGWEASRGAQREVALAAELGIPRYDYDYYDANGLSRVVDGEFTELHMPPAAEPAITAVEDTGPTEAVLFDDAVVDGYDPERVQYSPTGGAKDNRFKAEVDQLPVWPLLEAAKVAGYGGRKYTPWNWRKGLSWSQQGGSMLRHVLAWLDGEDIDPESGHHHLAHAATQALYTLEFVHSDTGDDDRWLNHPDNPNRETP